MIKKVVFTQILLLPVLVLLCLSLDSQVLALERTWLAMVLTATSVLPLYPIIEAVVEY